MDPALADSCSTNMLATGTLETCVLPSCTAYMVHAMEICFPFLSGGIGHVAAFTSALSDLLC